MLRLLSGAVLLIAAGVACEAIVNTSPLFLCDGGNSGKCLSGYSCDGGQCVALASLKAGDTCSEVSQCQSGLTCPPGINKCLEPCTKIYQFNDNECDPDQVCAPVFDRQTSVFSGGACVPTECTADPFCQDPNNKDQMFFATPSATTDCVRLAQNGGLCLQSCLVGEKSVPDGGPDECGDDVFGNPTHCGIINPGAAPDYICLPSGNAAVGQACSLFPTGSNSADACSLNTGSEPLVCMNVDGTLSGDLRCQQVCAGNNETLGQCSCTGSEAPTAYPTGCAVAACGFAYCAPSN